VISTETSALRGATVKGKASDELAPLVDQLARKIAAIVADPGERHVPRRITPADRAAALRQKLHNARLPSVMVVVPERHLGRQVADPAAQTEIIRFCREAGFEVIDHEEGVKGQADVLINGEGLSELAIRRGNLVSIKARLEIKAVDRRTGRIL